MNINKKSVVPLIPDTMYFVKMQQTCDALKSSYAKNHKKLAVKKDFNSNKKDNVVNAQNGLTAG